MPRVLADRASVVPLIANAFRVHGYEGTSISTISQETHLGRGSLYHFFPGGKEEMAAAVLEAVEQWFRKAVFDPLAADGDPHERIRRMFTGVEEYFLGHHRVCLFGAFALGHERDNLATAIATYFREWIDGLRGALVDAGWERNAADELATDVVSGIQGALVLSHALGDPAVFGAALSRLRASLEPVTLS